MGRRHRLREADLSAAEVGRYKGKFAPERRKLHRRLGMRLAAKRGWVFS
jgi:hypothetical protein